MSTCLGLSQWSHLQYYLQQNVIMHEVVVLNKHKGFTHCLEVIPHRQSSQHWASSVSDAARSRYPWTGVCACVCVCVCVCVFIFALRKHLEENTIKRALQYVRWLSTSTFPSPHWRQRHKSQNDHYSKESSISCQRSAARRSKGANPEDDTLQWRHDNTPYAPSSFGRRQISRWRHRWSMRIRGGGPFCFVFFYFPSMSVRALK